MRRRVVLLPAACAIAGLTAALSVPSAALAHAGLVRSAPAAARVALHAPDEVVLSFSEPVQPRLAVISVTDRRGRQLGEGAPRTAGDPRVLQRAVRRPRPGWYLVTWRVVSADGHPVRGAYTFAVGPGPGVPARFAVGSLRETAATVPLVAARWAAFVAVMCAVGLFVLRAVVVRPLSVAPPGGRDPARALTVAWAAAVAAALVLVPVYLVLATAKLAALRAGDLSAVLPLLGVTSFGRAIGDLAILVALFGVAAGGAIWADRPRREQRSVVAVLAVWSALACAAAALLAVSLAGHAAQTSPAGRSVALDWAHLAAGSVWLGGLVGLLVLWTGAGAGRRGRVLAIAVPRFSRLALGAVLVLVATGTLGATAELPTLTSLWQTAYGRALLVKVALLAAALVLGAVNLLVTAPRLGRGTGTALLRGTVAGEIVLVAGAVLGAAVLTSLPPPARALARAGDAIARVGPGPVSRTLTQGDDHIALGITPNRAVAPNRLAVTLRRGGRPLTGATVVARSEMLDMDMGVSSTALRETAPGTYERRSSPLLMVGNWGVTFEVTPRRGPSLRFLVVDKANG